MSDSASVCSTPKAAKEYQAMKNRLILFNLALNFLFLLVFVLTGFSRSLKIWLLNFRDDFFSIIALYFTLFYAIAFLLSLPLDFYEGFILEHRYGLSRLNFKSWLKEVLKKSGIAFIVSLILVEAVYFFLSEFEGSWWLWASLFWFFISIVLTKITPRVILPLFYKYKPLTEGILRQKIFSLIERYKIRLKDIYVLDFSKKTVKANAFVAGLGSTKQIFLSDTLVNEFSPQEIEVVLAHEIGHYLNRDMLKLVLSSLCSALLSFFIAAVILEKLIVLAGFRGLSDIAGLPLLLIVLMSIGLILLPLQNGYSRILEKKADHFALKATGMP